MKTRTSVHPFQRPIAHAAGWLLLAITIWLFGFMGNAQAQVQTPAKPAMPAPGAHDRVLPGGCEDCGLERPRRHEHVGVLSGRGFTPHPVRVIPATLKKFAS